MAKKPTAKRKPAKKPIPTKADMKVVGGDIHQQCSDRVLGAIGKLNEAIEEASKQGTLVLLRPVGEPKRVQLECEIYKLTRHLMVFNVTPKA